MAITEAETDAPNAAPPADTFSDPAVFVSADLDEFQPAWEALAPILPSPMETFGWSAAAAASLAGDQRPRLVVAGECGSIRAIAPLTIHRGIALGRLELIGMELLNEPGDIVFTDQKALKAVVRGAIRLGRPILLGRLPAESPTIEVFRQASKRRGKVIVRDRPSYPFIPLGESWLEPERHLSSRRRSDYRRA
ncbi:MAG TPA: hypothetical protein VKB78_12730, partial [Pirellulales bacterium]|nr:hypothetical protein [Pirellulales bacterium]